MFRFAFVALALIAFGAFLAGGAELGAGLLVLAPLFILGKIFVILLFIGVIGGFWRGYDGGPPRPPWTRRRPNRRRQESTEKSRAEQFEEWHRMSHARDEVDTWVEDLD